MGTMSSLAQGAYIAAAGNYSKGRQGYKICKITPHVMAGILTAKQCAVNIFQKPGREASANYCIGNAGEIVCNVYEEDRSYCSSSRVNDCQAITVEVSNNAINDQWPISDAAWNSLIELCVDVCRRYNFRLTYDGTPNGSLTRHNMFANKSCPGPYLQAKLPELARIVNERLDGGSAAPVAPQPAPSVSTSHKVGDVVTINGIYTASNSTKKLNPARNSGIITKIISGAINPYLLDNGNLGWTNDSCIVGGSSSQPAPAAPSKKSNEEIAREVIAGQWGNGEDRKNKLAAAGYDYNAVQSAVNAIVAGKPVSNTKSATEIAKEVIAGKWGNGADRKARLQAAGYNYNTIQAEVNRLLK